MLKWLTVGAKQNGNNARWQYIWENIESIIPRQQAVKLVERKAAEVASFARKHSCGYAWSGGKDSQPLRLICEMAGVTQCVMGMTIGLEYPEFLQWATDNMPPELDIIANEGMDLRWLADNPDMLFPQDSATAAKWFRLIQHKAQAEFFKRYSFDAIILGRRLADRNHCGENGIYTNGKGITRYSPLYDVSHEMTLAICYYYDLPMAPFYNWVNGWVVGTGAWPARQWTGSIRNGWAEVYQNDPSVVIEAANLIPSADEFMQSV